MCLINARYQRCRRGRTCSSEFFSPTQKKLGAQPVHAQWHPQRRGYARYADPQGVRVYGFADARSAQVDRVQSAVVLFDVHGRHLAHGHVFVRMLQFELLEPVEQLREPHHQRVVTATKATRFLQIIIVQRKPPYSGQSMWD